ncbi:MAG: hypothetical protein AAGG72_04740 [Pseudomonadota bacterium]
MIGCVWELAVIGAEQRAWRETMMGVRFDPAPSRLPGLCDGALGGSCGVAIKVRADCAPLPNLARSPRRDARAAAASSLDGCVRLRRGFVERSIFAAFT